MLLVIDGNSMIHSQTKPLAGTFCSAFAVILGKPAARRQLDGHARSCFPARPFFKDSLPVVRYTIVSNEVTLRLMSP